MKKYRQVLAGLLSMSLIINTMAAGAAKPSLAAEDTDWVGAYEESEVHTENAVVYAEDGGDAVAPAVEEIEAEEPAEHVAAVPVVEEADEAVENDEIVVEPSVPTPEVPSPEAPVTEAPVTEAPVTEAPVTEAPVTEAPVTEAPVTEAPVTEAPATEAPTTEPSDPTTEAPSTEDQQTEPSESETSGENDPETDQMETIVPETEPEDETETEPGDETETESEDEMETETETETEDISTQELPAFDGTLKPAYFSYDDQTNTVTLNSSAGLILLSHCAPEDLANLNIVIKSTGSGLDITVTTTIQDEVNKGQNGDLPNFPSATAVVSDALSDALSQNQEENNTPETSGADVNTEAEASPEAILIEENEAGGTRTKSAGEDLILDESDLTKSENAQVEKKAEESSDSFIISIEEAGSSAPESGQASVLDGLATMSEEDLERAMTQVYSYQSIGTEEHPFAGSISCENALKMNQTIFGTLSSAATTSGSGDQKIQISWAGTDAGKCILSDNYVFETKGDQSEFAFPVQIASASKDSVLGTLIGTVKKGANAQDGVLIIDKIDYDTNTPTVSVTRQSGNAGLICSTLESGTIRLNRFKLPGNGYTVTATGNDNAGGLIGEMGENTALQFASGLTNIVSSGTSSKTASVTVTSSGNAGGLVGKMNQGAQLNTENSATVTLKNMTITGSRSAGGVVGTAEKVDFSDDDLKAALTVENSVLKGDTAGAAVGGFVGVYTVGDSGPKIEYELSKNIQIKTPSLLITGSQNENGGNAGGYFGCLYLKGQVSYTLGNTNETTELEVKYRDNGSTGGNAWSYGGLVGVVKADNIASTLTIQRITVDSTFPIFATSSNRPKYHGGLVGYVGSSEAGAYVKTDNTTVAVKNPHGIFGGAVGGLAENSILSAGTITVTTEADGQDAKIWDGGGVLGEANAGSVLELSGTTNLSGVKYEKNDKKTGQLVGANKSALIYAKGSGRDSGRDSGWTYIRSSFDSPSNGNTYNDLLCYGQVIRLKAEGSGAQEGLSSDLITINEEHKVILKKLSDWSESRVTLKNADDFALLSIAWNSRGYFGSESGISTSNWKTIKSSTITIGGDIDLTGTGITGVSRDTALSEDDTFTGTLTAAGTYTINLASGETYGYQSNDGTSPADHAGGCGIVYATGNYHAAQGLFAAVNGAKINTVVIDGSISVSNANGPIAAGGIAAYMQGGSLDETAVQVSSATAQETIYADGSAQQEMKVGGLFGAENGGWLNLNQNTVAAPKITLEKVEERGPWISAGGVLGKAQTNGFKLKVNGAQVGNGQVDSSNITTDATNYAYIGGLIGLISTDNPHWIEIYDLTIDGITITADGATEVSGGLFGGIWQNVGVYFMGTGSEQKAMLTVKNCIVSAENANGVGGLAYRSSGIWEVRDYGIDIQGLSIKSGGDVGLLVCRGEKSTTLINNLVSDTKDVIGALYLSFTAYWGTSYKLAAAIEVIQNTGVFDEFVAHTTETAKKITDNNINGVISIATKSDGKGSRIGVEESGTTCTTYQNRTMYGKSHQGNGCSRYYYDLDQWLKEASAGSNGKIDTPQELMLWSVWNYACNNIKVYIIAKSDQLYDAVDSYTQANGRWYIQNAQFDMRKYSYYPVSINNSSINISSATFHFYNEEIEEAEKGNKLTQGTEDGHTQHYTMHCGLLYSYASPSATLTVDNVTFLGSIGKVKNSASGVLIANKVNGYLSGTTPRYVRVSITNNTILKDLKVVDCGKDYAPLLINSIGSYTTVNVNGLKAEYENEGRAVASSLIGTVGDTNATQINLTFNHVVLPDKKAAGTEGIFSHATLLESFVHDGTSSGAMYTFLKEEEWSGTKYTHGVTYGKEITETVEYKDLQKWYYDEDGYGSEANLVHTKEGQTDFSASNYLPYVCVAYDRDHKTHEIKVNQRMDNIVTGCGTYGHPYVITSAREMTILSAYLNGGNAPQGWCITITGDQNTNHSSGDKNSDVTYKYNSTDGWVQVTKDPDQSSENWPEVTGTERLKNEVMRTYLLNAYYDLQGTETNGNYVLPLTDFGGFGNQFHPFRGVLTSTKKATVMLQGTAPANGLIGYSYGCVVKNLVISYVNCSKKTIEYQAPTDAANYYYSTSVFGGVIGCVLGGDNIIDGVSVQYGNNWLTLSGNKRHLIPAGGYVGEVSGGGVILRNIKLSDQGLTDKNIASGASEVGTDTAYANLYVNPYVGRVLDGFAFYEMTNSGTATDSLAASLNNTNKNYQINTLSSGAAGCITVSDDIVTLNSATGFLVLSAIVNSGAASSGNSNAYKNEKNSATETVNNVAYTFAGAYGKVRNASYSAIGTSDTAAAADFTLSQKDDQSEPTGVNLPYLITKYCGSTSTLFSLSGSSDVKIALQSNGAYDLTTFGSGYQGIGARYVSNAILNGNGVEATGIVPQLNAFEGNNSTITLNVAVREYVDDDFRIPAVGGVLNELRVGTDECSVSNLTIRGKAGGGQEGTAKAEVSLNYYNADGKAAAKASNIVDVGGFAGTISRISNKRAQPNVSFVSVSVQDLSVTAPRNAGGLLGSSTTQKGTDVPSVEESLVEGNNDAGISLENTSYSNLTVTGITSAGGFVGWINNKVGGSLKITKDSFVVGADSKIESTYDVEVQVGKNKETDTGAGGVFGYVAGTGSVLVNNNTGNNAEILKSAIIENVTVKAGRYAGGYIGQIDGSAYQISDAVFRMSATPNMASVSTLVVEQKNESISSDERREGAGGIVGYICEGDSKTDDKIQNCSVAKIQINDENTAKKVLNQNYEGAGGIVGLITDGKNSAVTIDHCTVTESNIYGAVAGGIAGITKVKTTFSNCTVTGTSKEEKSWIKGRCTAGSILGYWFSGSDGTIENCIAQYLDIGGQHWGVGGLIGDDEGVLNSGLYLFNTSVQDSTVTANTGSWYQCGGIIGDLRSNLTAGNLLFSNVEINMTAGVAHYAGLLIGNEDQSKNGGDHAVHIAGVSIQNIPEKSKGLPLAGNGTEMISTENDYIAFADYSGAAFGQEMQGSGTDLLATAAAPYVVTSPKSSLHVYESDTASEAKYLYGDGAFWENAGAAYTTMAQTIWNSRNNENGDHYAYAQTGVNDFMFNTAMSTYNENQTTKAETDFPVLQISRGDVTNVTAYLDILTNGGFSQANNLNQKGNVHVNAAVDVYQYKNGKFVKAGTDSEASKAFQVTTDSDGKITFSATSHYDNDENRFNLLTVTFTEENHNYCVMIPILVRRVLEVDFVATLGYGTHFKKEDYNNLTSHVLESFGNSVTAYLTYTYNSDENGNFVDYGWQSYINAGGDIKVPFAKMLWFKQNNTPLVEGTQLTLIDCQDENRTAYYYTVQTPQSGVDTEVNLADFVSTAGKKFSDTCESIGELLQVNAEESETGTFVEVDENGNLLDSGSDSNAPVTVKIKLGESWKYYRLAKETETAAKKYAITVKTENLKTIEEKSKVAENYYLVITIPEGSEGAANGELRSKLNNDTLKYEMHELLRAGGTDSHENTASTYRISSGYSQQLEDTLSQSSTKKLSAADSSVYISIRDKISFEKGQFYVTSDQLYQRFVGSLQVKNGENMESALFPDGTNGEVSFYVYTESGNTKTYYTYNGKTWDASGTEKAALQPFRITSNGGNLELVFSTDGTPENAVSLQGVRDKITGSEFYIEAKLDASIPADGLGVIPQAQPSTEGSLSSYAKISFTSQLAVEKNSLSYSSMRASLDANNTKMQYYREEPVGAVLTYDAYETSQLGINLLDLDQNSRSHATINTTATYDLKAMQNVEDTLKDSSGIRFTLSLEPKNSNEGTEAYADSIQNAKDYMDVEVKTYASSSSAGTYTKVSSSDNTWSWTVSKGMYYNSTLEEGNTASPLLKNDVFDGTSIVTQQIQLLVRTDNVEASQHFYSNYKVTLKAEVLNDSTEDTVEGTTATDHIIYTLAKISTQFVDNKQENVG